jgi:hypothetical protein
MARPLRVVLAALAVMACAPAVGRAGMPSIRVTDVAGVADMRIQTISFFLMGLLLSALFVQLLWNRLRRDFVSLPRLGCGGALGVVVLWGLLFVLVLTMISGARELMTPGAWEKQGATYRLATPPTAPRETEMDRKRQQKMERLRTALWEYAQAHGGRFPPSDSVPEIAGDLWQVSGMPRLRYLYVPGLTADQGAAVVAYEPGVYGDRRLVLLTNGDIKPMKLEEILHALPPEKP